MVNKTLDAIRLTLLWGFRPAYVIGPSGSQCQDYWIHKVGGAQRLLPMHVLHEYCRPDRPFDPIPGFTEETLPRTLNYHDYNDSNDKDLNLDDLGSNFGFFRGSVRTVARREGVVVALRTGEVLAFWDHAACVRLLDVRAHQRNELIASLTQGTKLAPPVQT